MRPIPRNGQIPARRNPGVKVAGQELTLSFTGAQLRRLKAGARFFGVTAEELCVAGCLNMLDLGNDSVNAAKETTRDLVKAYARKRVIFYRPEDGIEHPVQVSR
jgi:hypothetical protein